MSRVRSRGEGSISKRRDGRYEVRLSLGTEGGQRRRLFLYAKSRADAVRLLAEARTAQKPGRPGASNVGETVEHFLARWLEKHVANKRFATVRSYEQNIRTHILPVIGSVRLAQLTREHVEAVQNRALAKGLKPSTVRLIRVILGSALKRAEMWEIPGARNMVRLVDGPKQGPSAQRKFLDPDQARAFLLAAAGSRWEAMWMVALYCGLRLGELQALRWQDVDLERRQLRVVNTYKSSSRGLEDVKTASSSAVVDLPECVAAALKSLRVRQMQEQGVAQQQGIPWLNEWGLVWTGDAGYPTGRTALGREFRRVLRQAGLPMMRIHDLRHSSGSLDLAAGVPLKLVQEKLRHARLATTADIYVHVTPVARREAADALERLLS